MRPGLLWHLRRNGLLLDDRWRHCTGYPLLRLSRRFNRLWSGRRRIPVIGGFGPRFLPAGLRRDIRRPFCLLQRGGFYRVRLIRLAHALCHTRWQEAAQHAQDRHAGQCDRQHRIAFHIVLIRHLPPYSNHRMLQGRLNILEFVLYQFNFRGLI